MGRGAKMVFLVVQEQLSDQQCSEAGVNFYTYIVLAFGNGIGLSLRVTQSVKSHDDFNSKIIRFKKQGKK